MTGGRSGELVLDETILPNGESRYTSLVAADGRLMLDDGTGKRRVVPLSAILGVMARYGRELDDGIQTTSTGLWLSADHRLETLRHRDRGDAWARDFLVLSSPGTTPKVILSTLFAKALHHLALVKERSYDV